MRSLSSLRGMAAEQRSRTYIFTGVLAAVLFVVNLIKDPGFVSGGTLPQTLANLAPFALVAMATVPSVVSGGLDFSIGPTLSLSNIFLVVVLLPTGLGAPVLAIPILLCLGAATGALSGMAISLLRVPAIITGLCALFVISGINQQVLATPQEAPSNWTDHLLGQIGPVPGALLLIAAPPILWLLLRRTPLITTMFSVGASAPTAFASGVNVATVRVIAYALGGMFAALGGIALTGVLHSADSTIGLRYSLIAIAAVSLGGTPIGGGRGGLAGALLGATSIFLIQNLLLTIDIPPQWLDVVYGAVLVIAVVLSTRIAPRGIEGAA
ncbi:MAG: ABC transporter permease [Actinobacteria bacterium]|nr:ABC transporter permease [Actinomycetota bacterium]